MHSSAHSTPKVLVIIVTYNGRDWLDSCLGSLRRSLLPLDTIVIDNGSTDGTPDEIRARFPEVQLVEPGENLGFGKGNNLGLKRALHEGYDYAFLLNQDAWIEPDTLSHLVSVHQQNPTYGILSPMHLDGQKETLDRLFADYAIPKLCPKLYSDLYIRPTEMESVYATEFVNAAAWLISRRCLETVGGFDPIFPHYGEDVDYLNRVRYHGLGIGICPAVTICHDRDTSMRIGPFQTPKRFQHLSYVLALARLKNPLYSLKRGLLRENKDAILDLLGSLPSPKERKRHWLRAKGVWKANGDIRRLRAQRKLCNRAGATFLEISSYPREAEPTA